jgi:hypothetical protein
MGFADQGDRGLGGVTGRPEPRGSLEFSTRSAINPGVAGWFRPASEGGPHDLLDHDLLDHGPHLTA